MFVFDNTDKIILFNKNKMIKNFAFSYKLLLLLSALNVLYANALQAQYNQPFKQFQDSANSAKQSVVTARKLINGIYKKDSLLSFKRIKVSSAVTIETHYYGIEYENTGIPKWTTTYQFNNKIDLAGIPFQLDAFLGDKVAIPGRGISRIHLKFDAYAFAQNMAKKALEQQQQKLINELKSDSNFQKYKTASQTVASYQDLLKERSYLNQIQNQQNLVKQYESIGDTAVLKKEIYKEAKKKTDQYSKRIKDLDSLKKYINYIDKINPLWKTLKDTTANLSKNVNLPDQKECLKQLENNKLIPAPLRWLSHVRKFEAGMVFPDFQPLIFKGAPLKGILVSAQKSGICVDATYGKLYSPGDFFRDTFITSKVYALAFRTGFEYKKLKVSYSLLQTHRINTTDTFAFRYYFESPKEATVQGLSLEWTNKFHKIFLHSANSDIVASQTNGNNEAARANDINKLLPGIHLPFTAKTAIQLGYKINSNKTKSEFTIKYNYQGSYYFSPMRVFTQPPGKQYEAILQQSFFKKQIQCKVGATLQQSKFSSGYFSYDDKTYSYNFLLNINIKKLPLLSISYLPYYRTSIYQNEEVLLKMEQLTVTSVYNHQKKNNFISLIGSYSRNKVENIYSGIYEQAALYSTYKNIKSPLGFNLMVSYFSKPMISKDSAKTYDLKAALEYQIMPTFIIHVGGGYAINKERSRYYPYFDLSWSNIYIGQLRVKADYTWLNEFDIYKQGMNVMCSLTRTIF